MDPDGSPRIADGSQAIPGTHVDIGICGYQPPQDALVRQLSLITPGTFDEIGADITLQLVNVVAGQQVQVLVGQTMEDLHSVGTFTNSGGTSPWLLSIDIGQANPTLTEAQYVAVGSDKPVKILSAVGLHPNLTDLSGSGYQQYPAVPASEPQPQEGDYTNVAQLLRWDWSTLNPRRRRCSCNCHTGPF